MDITEASNSIGKHVRLNYKVDIRDRGVGVLLQGYELVALYDDFTIQEVDNATNYVKITSPQCEYCMWLNPEHIHVVV